MESIPDFIKDVIPSALLVIGIAITVATILDLGKGRASRTWPTALGRVIDATVVENKVDSYVGTETVYRAKVRYRYAVSEIEYLGYRICYGSTGNSKQIAKMIVERYPPGRKVAVFYDPSKPAESVLLPGTRGLSYSNIAVGLLLATIGVVGLLGGLGF